MRVPGTVKVLFIAGSYPPAFCGVGEYTANLKRALGAEGVEARVAALEGRPDYRYADRNDLQAAVQDFRPDLVHLEYPGRAFGASFLPLAFSELGVPAVLTLHEFRLSHPLRKAFNLRLVRRAGAMIVPAKSEWESVPWLARIGKKAEVIPVGPSFEPPESANPGEGGTSGAGPGLRFVFLGFLNKSKNFRLWFEVLEGLRDSPLPKPFVVLTGTPMDTEEMRNFREGLRSRGLQKAVEVRSQRPSSEVSRFLLEGAVGFLPFADGATPRRTTLLTLLAHGVPVIVPPPLDGSLSGFAGIATCDSAEAVLSQMQEFTDPGYFESGRAAARELARRFSWAEIARRHRVFYNQIVQKSRGS